MPPLTTRAKVLLALVLVVGLILVYDLLKERGPGKSPRPLSVAALPAPSPPVGPGRSAPIPEERWKAMQERASRAWGRDPFALPPARLKGFQPETPKGPPLDQALKVTGVVRNGRQVYAVVNDFLVKPGDEILGAKVVEIREDAVILQKDGREHLLKFGD